MTTPQHPLLDRWWAHATIGDHHYWISPCTNHTPATIYQWIDWQNKPHAGIDGAHPTWRMGGGPPNKKPFAGLSHLAYVIDAADVHNTHRTTPQGGGAIIRLGFSLTQHQDLEIEYDTITHHPKQTTPPKEHHQLSIHKLRLLIEKKYATHIWTPHGLTVHNHPAPGTARDTWKSNGK